METKTIFIDPDRIHPNPDNPRHEAGDVTGLAHSLTKDELLHPLLVIPHPLLGTGQYMLEDGYRRWVAARTENRPIECKVRYPEPDEDLAQRAIVTGLLTDLHKEHLPAIDRAKAYGRLRDEFHMTQSQIARRFGLNDGTVGRYLALLELTDRSQEAVRTGKLSVEKAVQAVQKNRAVQRKKKGKRPADVGWEPDHFTAKHHQAKRARAICDARKHTSRRRLGDVACGQCWEEAIRQDQTTVLQAAYLDAQRDGQNAIFMAPFTTADGAARNGVIGNG